MKMCVVKLLISEAARAFRDDGDQDSDIVLPRADASLAGDPLALCGCGRQLFEAVLDGRLRRR